MQRLKMDKLFEDGLISIGSRLGPRMARFGAAGSSACPINAGYCWAWAHSDGMQPDKLDAGSAELGIHNGFRCPFLGYMFLGGKEAECNYEVPA